MEVTIYSQPCWLLEAAELVYGLVNQIPAEKMTADGPFCIPAEQVLRIRDAACAGIDPSDEIVRLYFKGVPLEGVSGRMSCLACSLLYSSLAVECSEPEDYLKAIRTGWHELLASGFRINGIDGFSLSLEPADASNPMMLSQGLADLHLPALYQLQLLEVFTAFDEHLERVAAILRPVAAALPELMAPWTRNIPSLKEQWASFFREHSAQEFFFRRARVKDTDFEALDLAFRFFLPAASPGKYVENGRRLRFHLGVSVQTSMDKPGNTPAPEEWELTALRLIANPARMEMLRLMANRAMSGQELSQTLNLNSGSVFRDLNSLYNARLLLMESMGPRNCYRTNVSAVRQIMDRMVAYIQNGKNANS